MGEHFSSVAFEISFHHSQCVRGGRGKLKLVSVYRDWTEKSPTQKNRGTRGGAGGCAGQSDNEEPNGKTAICVFHIFYPLVQLSGSYRRLRRALPHLTFLLRMLPMLSPVFRRATKTAGKDEYRGFGARPGLFLPLRGAGLLHALHHRDPISPGADPARRGWGAARRIAV